MSFPTVNGVEVGAPVPTDYPYAIDFENPTRDWPTINSSYWSFGVLFIIAFLFLGQRVYTAIFIQHRFRSDDYMIVAAWVLTTVAQALIITCLNEGILGTHIFEMSLELVDSPIPSHPRDV